jgi:formate hydrogenlyase subunit 6/NADH:ubiquinone oxidoreductase subunit I
MAVDERQERKDRNVPGLGLLKGLTVTLKHMLRRSVTQQYPHEKPELPARTRGVIALKEANCTVCYKCSRACPDWCIYIDAHKETHDPAGGGKARSVKVLDRFAIDYALCMYCGICVEVCPFDALFWSPEYEYAEYDLDGLLHEKERLEDWTQTVLPPPELEVNAELPPEPKAARVPTVSAAPATAPAKAPPVAGPVGGKAPSPKVEVKIDEVVYDQVFAEEVAKGTPERVAQGKAKRAAMLAAKKAAGVASVPSPAIVAASDTPSAATAPAAPSAPKVEVEPDQTVYDAVFAEEVAKGTLERVAQGKAKRAAMLAARKKATGSDPVAPSPAALPAVPSAAPSEEATAPTPAASTPAPAAPKVEVEPDQEVYDRVFAEEIAKGTLERVAQGKAKRAAMLAARKKAQG